jgi:hypothetical protein
VFAWLCDEDDNDGDFYGQAPPPDDPTDAEPGSDEKIEIMALRYEQRRQLFHPDDRQATSRISRVMPGRYRTLTLIRR